MESPIRSSTLLHNVTIFLWENHCLRGVQKGANGAPAPGIQRLKLQKCKCFNLIFPIVRLLTHTTWISFFETCFVVNTCYVFKCQQFSTSSRPGTCTLGVPSASNQTDSDMTCSRSYDQGKITKKD